MLSRITVIVFILLVFAAITFSVVTGQNDENTTNQNSSSQNIKSQPGQCVVASQPEGNQKSQSLNPELPTIGVLVVDDVLLTEVAAPFDVFGKHDANGNQRFNVILIGKEQRPYLSEEGLTLVADFSFSNAPPLTALIVPGAFQMQEILEDQTIVNFVRKSGQDAEYLASNCAGAFLLGKSGLANNRKIVTYVGGGQVLRSTFPKLKVQNDSNTTHVIDENIISSNGNLTSYISALLVLEKMTDKSHRKYVESQLYLNRLKKWNGELE
ncbi:DJ-1/PfpI family protein [Gimesia aquarii]|uniref:Isonitrile hydratase n=1 Tax=Gimesia aquarii TaxID=2527964 RepID=A0A517WY78_9PLAN|nr:DJ-1/PfpI family protein [Gimesia aquarii]QDU10198.1 Isonitrile hydratase [Gimesia aquarii]